jgi:hypothetical protein
MSEFHTLSPAPSPGDKPRWYLARDGERQGPLTTAKLYAMAGEDRLETSDLVWRPGFPAWRQAGEVAGLLSPPPLPQGIRAMPSAETPPPPLPFASGE